MVALTWRTDGPWGPATTADDLAAAEIDNNFYYLLLLILEKAAQGVGISNVVVNGNEFTFVLTDHTLLGPYPLPVMSIQFLGEWLPDTTYAGGDIITHVGQVFLVQVNHTSDTTFDPGKQIDATDVYKLILEMPGLIIPAGGATGAFLRKVDGDDYNMYWGGAALDDLDDVTLTTPAEGQILMYVSGIWANSDFPTITLAGLSDVLQSPAPITDDLVTYNGTNFTYVARSDVEAKPQFFGNLQDVNLNGFGGIGDPPTGNDVATYSESDGLWVNYPKQKFVYWSDTTKTVSEEEACGSIIDNQSGSDCTLTIPSNLPLNSFFWIRQQNNPGQITIVGDSGITLQVPIGRVAKTRNTGSVVRARNTYDVNVWELDGDLEFDSVAIPSGGGTINYNRQYDTELFTWTPTSTCTLNLFSAVPKGKRMTIVITTSGTSSYTLTFGTNFKSTGTLATGTVTAKVFVIAFISDGTNMNEISRTVAM